MRGKGHSPLTNTCFCLTKIFQSLESRLESRAFEFTCFIESNPLPASNILRKTPVKEKLQKALLITESTTKKLSCNAL